MAFFHCQHQARNVQSLSNILGCLLSQLYNQDADITNIPFAVNEAFKGRQNLPPVIQDLQQWLLEDIQARTRTIILLDGLYEMDQQLREELIGAIDLTKTPALQLILTSHPLPDIGEALLYPTNLDVYAPAFSFEALIASRLKSPSSRRFLRLVEDQLPPTMSENSIE